MKLLTRPRLIVLTMVIAIVAIGVWLDRRDAPIRDGLVVVDKAFLQRLRTEDPETTRDPAIKALTAATFKGDILRNMLMSGAVTVDIRRLDRDSVEVTVAESFNTLNTTMAIIAYRRHRMALREFISPASWKEAFLRREYWEQGNFNREIPRQPLPPQTPLLP